MLLDWPRNILKMNAFANLPTTIAKTLNFMESPMLLCARLISCENIREANNQYAGSIILHSFTCNVRWGRITLSIFWVNETGRCSLFNGFQYQLFFWSVYPMLSVPLHTAQIIIPRSFKTRSLSCSNKANLKLRKSCQKGYIQLVQRITQLNENFLSLNHFLISFRAKTRIFKATALVYQ